MSHLYHEHGITSIMVEGGAKMLQSFIDCSLFDEIRIESSPNIILNGIKAPRLPDNLRLTEEYKTRENTIRFLTRNQWS